MLFEMPGDEDDDDSVADLPVPEGAWPAVNSLWAANASNMAAGRWATRVGGTANTVAGTAASIGKTAATTAIGAKVAAGVGLGVLTAGTGGLALIGAGAGMSLVSAGLSARSFAKTWDHIEELAKIAAQSVWTCGPAPGGLAPPANFGKDHNHIQTKIIRYIITQKTEKLIKKGVGVVPGAAALTGAYGVMRNLYKRATGTLGRKRSYYAYVVARHTITHDCALCAALVSELFSKEDYDRLKTMNSDDAGGWIARKMKSN